MKRKYYTLSPTMVPKILLIFTTIIIITIAGCGKFDLFDDMSKSLPLVEIISVESYHDSTLLIGNIISEGAAEVTVCGFSYNSKNYPNMADNQILLNGSSGQFAFLTNEPIRDSNYYFTAFAYNEYGYKQSESIFYKIPAPAPPHIPCTLNDNSIVDNFITYDISDIKSGWSILDGFRVIASYSHNKELQLFFHERPQNGIYSLCSYNMFHSNEDAMELVFAKIYFYSGSFEVKPDGLIYVEELNDTTISITCCEMIYTGYSSEFTITSRIIVDDL